MRPVAILFGVIAVIVATPRAGMPVNLNVAFGSSVERTFFVDDDTDQVFTMRNQSRTPLIACCFYVNRSGHCANSGDVCFGKNSCGSRDLCIAGCSQTDFVFEIGAKTHIFQGANAVQWSARDGLLTSAIPPVAEIPFFGDLICDLVGVDDECPVAPPCP